MPTQPVTQADKNQLPVVQQIVSIMWPSFLLASLATIVFFTVFDPHDLGVIGGFPELTRLGAYTIGFFLFWILTSMSSGLTCYFRRPCPTKRKPSDDA